MAGNTARVTRNITTGVGIACFPNLSEEKAKARSKSRDDGSLKYDIQVLIPKTDRAACRALLAAMKEVGVEKWGDAWKSQKLFLRDGDKEADKMSSDGVTLNRDRFPERLGCFFFNASSTSMVAVVGRDNKPINPNEVYAGAKVRVNVDLYTYNNQSVGIAAGLNGVQKVADGDPIGGSAPSVDSMFDLLDDSDDGDGLDEFADGAADDETEVEEPAPKKRAAKKAPAKKAATKKATAKPAPEPEPDDEDDLFEGDDDGDEFDDLDND